MIAIMKRLDIAVDVITECLIDSKTGGKQETEVSQVEKISISGWQFDWNIEIKSGHIVHAIKLKGQSEIQGLVSLDIDHDNKAVLVHLADLLLIISEKRGNI